MTVWDNIKARHVAMPILCVGMPVSRLFLHRAFSLIEAAIVLALVGLVIGGLWTAASAVQREQLDGRNIKGMLAINENIRKLYQGQDVDAYIRLEGFAQEAGLLDGAEGYKAGTATRLIAPNGTQFALRIDSTRIVWDGNSLSVNECVKFLSKIMAMRDTRLISVNFGGTVITTFPQVPTATQCAVGTGLSIAFAF